jgi:penicillin amidase
MMALGYVHAQDRLWQMELMRRIAPEDYLKFLVQ